MLLARCVSILAFINSASGKGLWQGTSLWSAQTSQQQSQACIKVGLVLGRLGFWGDGAREPFHVAGSSSLRTLGYASVPDVNLNALCEHQGGFCIERVHVRLPRALLAISLPAGHHIQMIIFKH